MKLNAVRTAIVAGALILGACIGWIAHAASSPARSSGQVRADLEALKFTNPLLFAGADDERASAFSGLAADLRRYAKAETDAGAASSVSIYFRDLDTGRWTGVNEDLTYSPASMLKVLGMMAVLKIAEQDPDFLTKQLYYKPDSTSAFYRPGAPMKAGYYSVNDLVTEMIVYSDNAAADALTADHDINAAVGFVYSLFRLPPLATGAAEASDYMSAKSYSSIFRALYNSTLFQWHISEQALELLSKTAFTDGLVAGVPAGTLVSHKFGETGYRLADQTVVHELHDCGIIYHPKDPYLLCVMTKGADFANLPPVIAGISKKVWDFVDAGMK
jgi:beta-lactamase class A